MKYFNLGMTERYSFLRVLLEKLVKDFLCKTFATLLTCLRKNKKIKKYNKKCFKFGFGHRANIINRVVSIGTNPTFKVKLVPMEYIPTMSKRLHFFGSGF